MAEPNFSIGAKFRQLVIKRLSQAESTHGFQVKLTNTPIMLHEPAAKAEKDSSSDWKAKLGIKLFLLYSLTYVLFVGLTVFSPETMKISIISGTNLAVVSGIAMIIFAVILGVVYNHFCTKKELEMEAKEGGAE